MEDIMNNGDDVHFLIAADNDEPIPSSSRSFDDSYFDKFPDGYRFTPTDEELILCYLKKKIENIPLPPNRIRDEDIYQFNPNTLAEKYKLHRESERYFFTPTHKKYENGYRPARSAGGGCWKATGNDKIVLCPTTGREVGYRKSLVFYTTPKPVKESKTDWIMHEYRLNDSKRRENNKGKKNKKTSVHIDHAAKEKKQEMLDVWVLCKLYKKKQPSTTTKLTRKKGKTTSSTSENEKENAVIKVEDQDQRLEGQEIYFVTEELSSSSSEELSSSSTSEGDVFLSRTASEDLRRNQTLILLGLKKRYV